METSSAESSIWLHEHLPQNATFHSNMVHVIVTSFSHYGSDILWVSSTAVTTHQHILVNLFISMKNIFIFKWLTFRDSTIGLLREREMFYLATHSTHFIYGYMASDTWLWTNLIARKETRCRHIGYSYRVTAMVLLYAPSHRQDSTYHGLCYTSRGALAGMRNWATERTQQRKMHVNVFSHVLTSNPGSVGDADSTHVVPRFWGNLTRTPSPMAGKNITGGTLSSDRQHHRRSVKQWSTTSQWEC